MADTKTKETRFTLTASATLRRRLALLKKLYADRLSAARGAPGAKVSRRETVEMMARDACRYHGLEAETKPVAADDSKGGA